MDNKRLKERSAGNLIGFSRIIRAKPLTSKAFLQPKIMSTSSLSVPAITASSPASSAGAEDHLSVTNLHFPFKLTLSIKFSNSKPPNLPRLSPLSLSGVFRPINFNASSGFDGFENTESGEIVEGENAVLEEEEEDVEVAAEENEETVPFQPQHQPADARRLFIGNLPFSMTSSQLAEIFAEAGRVVSVQVMYDKVTDRSRGFAFATMGSIEEAKEAIRLFDGAQVGGRTVKVNFPEVPRGGERQVMGPEIRSSYQGFVDTPHKIYAGNLSWGLTSQGLRETFQDQPGFLSAKVIYDRNTGRSRGFGFVTFASSEEVEAALNAMNEVEVEGRPLRLNLAEQRSPVSPPRNLETGSAKVTESNEVFSGVST